MPSKSSSTHATRNPTRPVQKSRGRAGRPAGKLTPAQKATRALQAAQRKLKKRELEEDIDSWYEKRDTFVEELAQRHNRTTEYIMGLLTNPSQFKSRRAISIRNAIVHDLALKAKARGEKLSWGELLNLADQVMLQPISKNEKARMVAQLEADRTTRRVGVRSNNLSAGADSRAVASRVQEEFMNLFERTGTRAVAFFSRGHVDDAFLPTYAESGGSMDFYLQSTKMAGLDLLRRYELWCCNQERAPNSQETLNGLRGQIKEAVTGGLQDATKNRELSMSYANYLVAIQQTWKVKLVGWPTDIPFVNPSKLGTIDRVRRIRDGLRSGSITWAHMQVDEIAEVNAEVERRRADGTLRAPRKPRKDAGKKHKRARARARAEESSGDEDDDDDEDEDDEDDDAVPGTSSFAAAASFAAPAYATTSPPSAVVSSSTAASAANTASSTTPVSTNTALTTSVDAAFSSTPPSTNAAPNATLPFANTADEYDPDYDYDSMVVDINALAADFGRYDMAAQALRALNATTSGAVGEYPTTSLPGGAFHPLSGTLPSITEPGAFPPTAYAASPSFPTGHVTGPSLAADAPTGAAPGSAPFGAVNGEGFEFSTPATPDSFTSAAKRPVVKAAGKRGATVQDGGVKKARKPRSDKGKPRTKDAAIENRTPEERAAALEKRKALAHKKWAAKHGRA
ncbi:hypothetical protein B0H15DRAFT_949931 [Mycena belliarum]|uniref:Uncharacterized protein n=1 Tax=Mycena belliarum TaxID=1033014 RepID=A0AAD6U2L9_9AGAR|nr:hypothetical protein B0H15DRAFT_951413 [Mycena belliae]KAJ7087557.1 hypothetical protein B0H15DRAFT_949931 [Mycena belliae]